MPRPKTICVKKIFSDKDIKLKKLDNITDYAHLIKLDVEGYEENVLKGAKKLLSENRIILIYVEISDAKKIKVYSFKKILKCFNDK